MIKREIIRREIDRGEFILCTFCLCVYVFNNGEIVGGVQRVVNKKKRAEIVPPL
jgi:hypothetical protein